MITVEENVSLAPFTTFHIGGPAKKFVRVVTVDQLAEAIRLAKAEKLPIFLLGGGSNLLISDQGFGGLVIHMENSMIRLGDETGTLQVGAGARLLGVVNFANEQGLQGLELLAGIPGSVGGAVRGNAGAFGSDIGASVSSVMTVHRETAETRAFLHDECEFSYRNSFFKQHPEWIVFGVGLRLGTGVKEDLERISQETIAKREAKHSQSARCAGSFFMNPRVTDEALRSEFEREVGVKAKDDKLPAGWVISHVGLRGKQVGGAKVSDQHPNYIVNTGTATAEDVVILTSVIKQKVRDELGVRLIEEVQMVGF